MVLSLWKETFTVLNPSTYLSNHHLSWWAEYKTGSVFMVCNSGQTGLLISGMATGLGAGQP